MKIGISGLVLKNHNTGIGNYLLYLINQMAALSEDTLVLFIFDEVTVPHPIDASIRIVRIPRKTPHRWFKVYAEQCLLPRLIKDEGVDCLFCPAYTTPFFISVPRIITVHDLAHLALESRRFSVERLYHGFFFGLSIRSASRIIAVSEATKQDILKYFPGSSKIVVTPLGPTPLPEKAFKAPKGVHPQDCFILSVGALGPRKNTLRVIKALELVIEHPRLKLVLTGKPDKTSSLIEDYIHRNHLASRVILVGFLTETELAWCYAHAQALAFCSLYEGFGLPLLEAMTHQTPIIASKVSSIPEVLGDAGLYVDPYDIEDIAQKIESILEDSQLRNKLIARGSERVKDFSWENTARRTLEALHEAFQLNPPPLQKKFF
jgi:glycosyltransferase involved in cell wall biosynthesis